MLSQGDKTDDPDLLSLGKKYLKEKFAKPGNVFLGLVHRLDRPSAGVMVLARTSKAAERLSAQFRERKVQKNYVAIVEGELRGSGACEDFLLKKEERVAVVGENHPGAQKARLRWRTSSVADGLSLVQIKLETGRKHQIRVQLANQGFPILGDFKYGARQSFDGKNLALHCESLSLTHPTQKTVMHWRAEPFAAWKNYFS
mgnify:CR=1 FL=1